MLLGDRHNLHNHLPPPPETVGLQDLDPTATSSGLFTDALQAGAHTQQQQLFQTWKPTHTMSWPRSWFHADEHVSMLSLVMGALYLQNVSMFKAFLWDLLLWLFPCSTEVSLSKNTPTRKCFTAHYASCLVPKWHRAAAASSVCYYYGLTQLQINRAFFHSLVLALGFILALEEGFKRVSFHCITHLKKKKKRRVVSVVITEDVLIHFWHNRILKTIWGLCDAIEKFGLQINNGVISSVYANFTTGT